MKIRKGRVDSELKQNGIIGRNMTWISMEGIWWGYDQFKVSYRRHGIKEYLNI